MAKTRGPLLRITTLNRAQHELQRAQETALRRRGRYRELVTEQLRANIEPRPADVARALREPIRPPQSLEGIRPTVAEIADYEALTDPPAFPRWLESRLTSTRRAEARESAWRRRLDDNARLCAHVAKHYVQAHDDGHGTTARKVGRPPGAAKLPTRRILAEFARLIARKPRVTPGQAHQRLAELFDCSKRQVERITKGYDKNS